MIESLRFCVFGVIRCLYMVINAKIKDYIPYLSLKIKEIIIRMQQKKKTIVIII